jgi:hypothetical protein
VKSRYLYLLVDSVSGCTPVDEVRKLLVGKN